MQSFLLTELENTKKDAIELCWHIKWNRIIEITCFLSFMFLFIGYKSKGQFETEKGFQQTKRGFKQLMGQQDL